MVWRIRDRRTFVALRTQGVRVRSGPLTITALLDARAPVVPAPPSTPDPSSPMDSSHDDDPTVAGTLPAGTVGASDPPRVAFAISRRVGHAVVRNRLRRQLRAICAELAGASLVSGAYLVSAQPAATALSYSELRSDVQRALSRLNRREDQHPTGQPGNRGRQERRRDRDPRTTSGA